MFKSATIFLKFTVMSYNMKLENIVDLQTYKQKTAALTYCPDCCLTKCRDVQNKFKKCDCIHEFLAPILKW